MNWSTNLTAKTTMLEPASGRPKRSSLRAISRSKPKRTGSAWMNSTAPTSAAATRPTARLIAPMPASAQEIETNAPSQPTTWSINIRRPARNSRCSNAADAAMMPSRTTLAARTWTTAVASGAPMAEQKKGAAGPR